MGGKEECVYVCVCGGGGGGGGGGGERSNLCCRLALASALMEFARINSLQSLASAVACIVFPTCTTASFTGSAYEPGSGLRRSIVWLRA